MLSKADGMLGKADVMATIAVKDLDAAKRFYEGTLGLEPTEDQEEGTLSYKSGGSTLFVYPSEHAGTNEATAATWVVGDKVDSIVEKLKAKGVAFEHYDLPGMTRQGDVHVAEGGQMKAAWLKDPDGNILAIAGE